MTIEQIKKSAKNLQRLLPEFLRAHNPPFSLTDLQRLVSQMAGYRNMEVAAAALKLKDEDGHDAMGSFYHYPWMDIDPAEVLGTIKYGTKVAIEMTVVDIASANTWFTRRHEAFDKAYGNEWPGSRVGLLAIVSAGDAGTSLIDKLSRHDQVRDVKESLAYKYGELSFCTLSQSVGITVNWLNRWAIEDVAGVLKTMVRPVCSEAQRKACYALIDVVVAAVDGEAGSEAPDEDSVEGGSARISVPALSSKLQALLALSEGGWTKNWSDGLDDEFGDFDGPASVLLNQYAKADLRALARPLESLLVRLAALETGSEHATSLGCREGMDNVDFSYGSDYGLRFVSVEMGSSRLDHVMAMAVLSKFAATVRTESRLFPEEKEPPLQVVLITR